MVQYPHWDFWIFEHKLIYVTPDGAPIIVKQFLDINCSTPYVTGDMMSYDQFTRFMQFKQRLETLPLA